MVSPKMLESFSPDDYPGEEEAQLFLDTATALIEGYTRGNHVDKRGLPRAGIDSVTLTVAARMMANPGQITKRDQAGNFSTHRGEGFSGFTLVELSVLNRYRKRAKG